MQHEPSDLISVMEIVQNFAPRHSDYFYAKVYISKLHLKLHTRNWGKHIDTLCAKLNLFFKFQEIRFVKSVMLPNAVEERRKSGTLAEESVTGVKLRNCDEFYLQQM